PWGASSSSPRSGSRDVHRGAVLRQAGIEHFSAGELYVQEQPAGPPVAQRTHAQGHLVAPFQRASAPPLTGEIVGAVEFDAPMTGVIAIGHIEFDERMGIGPLEFADGAF